MVYGLTKGQASPTSMKGFKTRVHVDGTYQEPFNPISVAISCGASFVARSFAGDFEITKQIIKKAILHRGYALVDILQPCVTYNKINTYQWYKGNTYYLDDSYDVENIELAYSMAMKIDKFPMGIIYKKEKSKTHHDTLAAFRESDIPLYQREMNVRKIDKILKSKL
jgi:2-oxoglutarate ferredoxin oxidoreductase subunit beta